MKTMFTALILLTFQQSVFAEVPALLREVCEEDKTKLTLIYEEDRKPVSESEKTSKGAKEYYEVLDKYWANTEEKYAKDLHEFFSRMANFLRTQIDERIVNQLTKVSDAVKFITDRSQNDSDLDNFLSTGKIAEINKSNEVIVKRKINDFLKQLFPNSSNEVDKSKSELPEVLKNFVLFSRVNPTLRTKKLLMGTGDSLQLERVDFGLDYSSDLVMNLYFVYKNDSKYIEVNAEAKLKFKDWIKGDYISGLKVYDEYKFEHEDFEQRKIDHKNISAMSVDEYIQSNLPPYCKY